METKQVVSTDHDVTWELLLDNVEEAPDPQEILVYIRCNNMPMLDRAHYANDLATLTLHHHGVPASELDKVVRGSWIELDGDISYFSSGLCTPSRNQKTRG